MVHPRHSFIQRMPANSNADWRVCGHQYIPFPWTPEGTFPQSHVSIVSCPVAFPGLYGDGATQRRFPDRRNSIGVIEKTIFDALNTTFAIPRVTADRRYI
jgi:hypothetical protein